MILPTALGALLIGVGAGFALARCLMLRTLVGLMLALVGLILFVSFIPSETLPGNGYATIVAAYLLAPPLAAGLFGGAVIAWLFRVRVHST